MNTRFTRAAMAALALAFFPFFLMAQPRSGISIRAFSASPTDRFDHDFSVQKAARTARFSGIEWTSWHRIFPKTYFGLPLALSKMREPTADGTASERSNLLSGGFVLRRQFLKNEARLNPFLQAGLGATGDLEGRDWAAHVPVSVGLNLRLAPGFFLFGQATYCFLSQKKEHCQFGGGVSYFFDDRKSGPKRPANPTAEAADRDGDGTPDALDQCPDERGRAVFSGCPDRDGDGVSDPLDGCPTDFGAAADGGCPAKFVDSDADGIDDRRDECPDQQGLLKFGGCPDSDFDDVPDRLDACPGAPGPAANKGCPTIAAEDQKILDEAVQNVQFETGAAAILRSSLPVFDQLAAVLKKYPEHALEISGHTDDVGAAAANVRLSTARAKACFDRLVARGVPAERLVFEGRGSAQPVASNLSSAGRQRNRRVEFRLFVR